MRFDGSALKAGLERLESKSEAAVRMFAEQGAQKLESAAKNNARWTDRTGSARTRLNGRVERRATGYRIVLAHGVDYGIWLELAHEKRYSIIPETIDYVSVFEIMPAFTKLLERLK